jgi:hypothetical protein
MSRHTFSAAVLGIAIASITAIAACSDSTSPAGSGTLAVQLTDAPFATDSVSRVDVYVVRIDTKATESDSADAAHAVSDDSADTDGWMTVGKPNTLINLLTLQNGVTTNLGLATLPAGSYSNFRLVIDPSRSSVTLKNGTVLTSTSSPSVSFPSAARSGIKVNFSSPVVISTGGTTTALVDFDVNNSFVIRGSSIASSGLIFKPVIRGTVK